MRIRTHETGWTLLIALIVVCLTPITALASTPASTPASTLPSPVNSLASQPASPYIPSQFWHELPTKPMDSIQIFNGDFEVDDGDVVNDDVVVYSGDVKVKKRGVIKGNVVAYSGKIEIKRDAVIEGDISAFSGDVKIEGVVQGDISAWSGDVELEDGSFVRGDISVLSGDIDRESGAEVAGNIYAGPTIALPKLPSTNGFFGNNSDENSEIPDLESNNPDSGREDGPDDRSEVEIEVVQRDDRPSFFVRFFGFVGRLIGFGFLSLLVTFLAAAVMNARPKIVNKLHKTIEKQTAQVFVAGFIANLLILLLATILRFTICLTPISMLLFLALAILNIVGWSATSLVVGRKIEGAIDTPLNPVLVVGVGSLLCLAAFVPMLALGGCLRFIAILGLLIISAPGAGAIVYPYLKSRT